MYVYVVTQVSCVELTLEPHSVLSPQLTSFISNELWYSKHLLRSPSKYLNGKLVRIENVTKVWIILPDCPRPRILIKFLPTEFIELAESL